MRSSSDQPIESQLQIQRDRKLTPGQQIKPLSVSSQLTEPNQWLASPVRCKFAEEPELLTRCAVSARPLCCIVVFSLQTSITPKSFHSIVGSRGAENAPTARGTRTYLPASLLASDQGLNESLTQSDGRSLIEKININIRAARPAANPIRNEDIKNN